MSSRRDGETERVAIEKAQEAWRLLRSGDYEGAIAACAEALELEPRGLGAYRMRADAYRRLSRKEEAAADLQLVRDISGRHEDRGWRLRLLVFLIGAALFGFIGAVAGFYFWLWTCSVGEDCYEVILGAIIGAVVLAPIGAYSGYRISRRIWGSAKS